jgi:hypothetical protein
LPPDRQIEHHRNFFATIRAVECVFHGNSMLQLICRSPVCGATASTRRGRWGRSFVSINFRGSNLSEDAVEPRTTLTDSRCTLSYLSGSP